MKILVIGDFQGVFSDRLFRKLKKEDFDLVVGVGDYAGIKDWKPYIMYIFRQLKAKKPLKSASEFYGKAGFKRLLDRDNKATMNVLRKLNSLGKPVFTVFGNGDDFWYIYPFQKGLSDVPKKHLKFVKRLKNLKVMTYSTRKMNGVNFVGCGGYMDIDAYFNKKHFSYDADLKRIKARTNRREKTKKHFNSLIKSGKKIFVFHYPPKGVFDIIRDKRNPMDGQSAGIGFFADAMKKHKPGMVLCGHMEEYHGMKKLHGIPVINAGGAEHGRYAIVDFDEDVGKMRNVRFSKA